MRLSRRGGVFAGRRAVDASLYGAAVLADSPNAYWRMEETSGTTVTDDIADLVGTLYGVDPNVASLARLGSAVSFDGVDDRIDLPTDAALEPTSAITYEVWAKPDTGMADSTNVMIWLSRQRWNHFSLLNRTTIRLTVSRSDNTLDFDVTVSDLRDSWHHLVGSYDGTTARVYVDAVEVGSTAYSGTISYGGDTRHIGAEKSTNLQAFFMGTLDEVAIYPTALSPARIQAHYDAGVG